MKRSPSKTATAKPRLTPKLRFPEFRDAGEWATETLGAVATLSTEKVGDKRCIPMSVTAGVGLVSQQEKFGRLIAGSSYKNYLLLKKNHFAYNKSATKDFPQGFIALYSGDELAAVPNSIFTCFSINGDSPAPQYLNYLFLGNLHGKWLRKFIEVSARAHGSLSVSDDDLLSLPIPTPSLPEQHRIASCLSSLDDLIAAERQKLDALKAHKQGLMQQLFPHEGETRPRLRFPEFRDAGEWETQELGALASISTERVGTRQCIPMSITAGVGLVSQQEKFGRIIAGGQYKSYVQLHKGDFAYNKSATKDFPQGYIALYSGEELAAVPNSIFTCFRIHGDSAIREYLNYLFLGNLHGRWLRKFITIGARAHGSLNIDDDDILSVPVPLPAGERSLAEQHRIASCLSSLDDLLAAQSDKVEALKTHKKGLLQQLFPSTEANL